MRGPRPLRRRVSEVLLLGLAYYLLAKLGLHLAYVGSNVTLIWAPTGIAIAALVRLGPRCWPGILLAATAVNVDLGTPWWAAVIMGVGNTTGPVLVAVGLRRLQFRPFERLRDVLAFAGLAIVGMMVAPTLGLLALDRAGLVPPGAFGAAWTMWWFGDLNGAFVVGPVLLTLRRDTLGALRGRAGELIGVGAMVVAVSIIVLVLTDQPLAFTLLVPAGLAMLRFPGLGSSSIVLLLASLVIAATVSGRGQFADSDVRLGLLSLSGFIGTVSIINLITMALLADQQRAHTALAASEAARLRALEAGAVGMFDLDLATGRFTVDEGTATLWGLPRAMLDGSHERLLEGIHPADRADVIAHREHARRTRTSYEATYRVTRPDGELRWVTGRGKYFYADDGEPTQFTGLVHDVTARTLAEIARRAADDHLALAARLAGFGTWKLDVATHRLTVSRELASLLGRTDVELGSLADARKLVHPDDAAAISTIEQSLRDDTPFQIELRICRPDDQLVDLAIHGSTADRGVVLGAALDITARKHAATMHAALERQLVQVQKTEALGRLAGGIAHDFNNILAAILPNAELLAVELPPAHDGQQLVEEIRIATLRGRELVQQILVFAKARDPEHRVIELAPVIDETLRLLRAAMPSTINLRTQLRANLTVLADPSQIHQIVMNLATNAQHAMDVAGGVIEITLTDVGVTHDFALAHDIAPGRFARFEVADAGHGMDAATLARVFEPFFTTKKAGEGTGLGLSLVHAIVRAYRGAITVASVVGRGTTFSIYLPIAAAVDAPAPPVSPLAPPGGHERILVVDDEPAVLASLGRLIASLGYEITQASTPQAALALLTQRPSPFDLLLTDMTMVDMTGVALAAEVHKHLPTLPVLIATGNSSVIDVAQATAAGVRQILEKPLTRALVARAIRQALDASRS